MHTAGPSGALGQQLGLSLWAAWRVSGEQPRATAELAVGRARGSELL